MPYNKVITDDKEQRKGFKDRTLGRVSNALNPAAPEPVVEAPVPIEVRVPSNFWELSDQELYGIVRQGSLTPEQVNAVIQQLHGREVGDQGFKIVLEPPVAEKVEVEKPVEKVPHFEVELPSNFNSYKTRDQYLYLTKEKALAPETANDIVDILQDKRPVMRASYSLTYGEAVPVNHFTRRDPEPLAPIDIMLPHNFCDIKRVYQEWMLTKDYGLSVQDSLDVLSVLCGDDINREVSITFEEAPSVEEPVEKEYPELSIKLPEHFENWRPQDQFLYLKTERKLSYDQSNDVIAALRGQSPLFYQIIIEE